MPMQVIARNRRSYDGWSTMYRKIAEKKFESSGVAAEDVEGPYSYLVETDWTPTAEIVTG